MIKRYNIIRR